MVRGKYKHCIELCKYFHMFSIKKTGKEILHRFFIGC